MRAVRRAGSRPRERVLANNRWWFGPMAIAVLLASRPARAGAPVALDGVLQPYLSRYGLPAIAAAVAVDGRVLAAGAVGTRRVGTSTAVTLDDRFHLGSDTKAMTALLAAQLVEEGRLRWGSILGEIFPELVGRMDLGLAAVMLRQLLSHTCV
jgi:CubicO group peptidase (beta-lactamase class C family)